MTLLLSNISPPWLTPAKSLIAFLTSDSSTCRKPGIPDTSAAMMATVRRESLSLSCRTRNARTIARYKAGESHSGSAKRSCTAAFTSWAANFVRTIPKTSRAEIFRDSTEPTMSANWPTVQQDTLDSFATVAALPSSDPWYPGANNRHPTASYLFICVIIDAKSISFVFVVPFEDFASRIILSSPPGKSVNRAIPSGSPDFPRCLATKPIARAPATSPISKSTCCLDNSLEGVLIDG